MNKLLGYIGVGIVVLLLIDIGYSIIQNQKNDADENRLAKGLAEGKIVEGYEVDFETERQLSDASLEEAEKVNEDQSDEQFIYTFHFCIGAKDYECLTNLLSDNLKTLFKQTNSNISPGEAMYQSISKGRSITGLEAININSENEITTYQMNVHLLDKKYPKTFNVEFSKNHILKFESGGE